VTIDRPRTGFPFLDRPVEEGAVLAFAHRGGIGHRELHGLENTVRAFEHAVGLGYRYLETDVQATRDGELLAFHDDVLDRATDGVGNVEHLEYADVATALVSGREPIPRLEELLEAFPGSCFNVDLKSAAGVDPLVDLVLRTGVQDRVCVASFNERVLRAFRARVRARSAVPVATSCGIVTATALAFLPFGRHLPALLRDTGAALQVPHHHRGMRVVDRGFVEEAHAAGRQVHVWTVNERDDMELLLDLGVDGIITDATEVLRDVLVGRGLWEGAS
jgi:glycerophosphoryl diester phosphodiesterase